jgi:hypothetical protein
LCRLISFTGPGGGRDIQKQIIYYHFTYVHGAEGNLAPEWIFLVQDLSDLSMTVLHILLLSESPDVNC